VRPHPDPDDPQLPFLDPTQYRYELIRPLLLCPDRTATQRAQETGTHPETVGRLKRLFAQQGMLGLVPDTLDVQTSPKAPLRIWGAKPTVPAVKHFDKQPCVTTAE
jgi:hypothetical protein